MGQLLNLNSKQKEEKKGRKVGKKIAKRKWTTSK